VVRHLGARAQTIAIDRPGWDGASRSLDLAGNADAALAALDARGAGRAVVAGHSLGGAVAAWLAAVHPERVAGLVLAAPAANLASLYRTDRWLALPLIGDVAAGATLAGLGLALSLPRLRRRIAAGSQIDEAYLRQARGAVLRPAAWSAYVRDQRMLVRDLPELERRLGRITAPTTILAGGGDRVVPTRAARELARQIPGAQLRISEHGGHLLPQREPALVAEAIAAALTA
jgi:pimeloyl-ACP methyl ester carboxylesterase